MNNNQERKKGSATPWLLGAGALGLGGIGLALASKGKAKTGSVVKQTKKATTIDVPKPQPSIKDELDQIRGQGQVKPKANMQDELDRMRNEAPKPQLKSANIKDELGTIRQESPKPQPTIKEEVAKLKNAESKPQAKIEESNTKINYRSKNIDPKFDGKRTYQSGVSGYGGLSPQERRAKLEKRRTSLIKEAINKDSGASVDYINNKNNRSGRYVSNPLMTREKFRGSRYTESEQFNNKKRNKEIINKTIESAKKRGIEYNANLFLLCDF